MNVLTMTPDPLGFGSPVNDMLLMISILLALTVALWTARRLIITITAVRQISRDLADMEQRLVFFRTALDMLAREFSDHLNTPHHKKGSLL